MEFMDLEFSLDFFKSTFTHMSHFLVEGPSWMFFEHFQDSFDPEDLANGFFQLFQMSLYVITCHIPKYIAQAFDATWTLTLDKPSKIIQPIVMGEVFY